MSTPARAPGSAVSGVSDRIHERLTRIPLRSRLVVITVALLLIAQLITVLATTFLLERNLRNRLDDELRTAVLPVADQASVATDESFSGTRVLRTLPTTYAVIFWSTTTPVTNTILPTNESEVPDIPRLTLLSPEVHSGRIFEVRSVEGDQHWRVLGGKSVDNRYTFAVAVSERGIDRTVQQVGILSTMVGLAAALSCLLAGWLAIHRAFRPLRRIEDTAAGIAAGDLTRRVPYRASGDEVESLSNSINVMLNRIETSFTAVESSESRMRQFVADASHELRTPLAAVRGYAELYRQGAVTQPEQVAQVMGRIEGEATRMSGLVEDLLALARLDEQRPMVFEETDLTVIVMDVAEDARAIAPDRRIRVMGLTGPLEPTTVMGDEAKLRQVVTNLVANALHHTPAGTPVEVAFGRVGDVARIEIRDHGAGIPPEEAARVFERFYRHDPSRTRADDDAGGSGLGLAIVAAIVGSHQGRVGVTETPGGGATFTVDLPSTPTAQSQHDPSTL